MNDTLRNCEQFARTHRCQNCGDKSILVVGWSWETRDWVVRCPRCRTQDLFEQPKSLTAMWRADPGSVPIAVANRLEAKYGGEPMSEKAIVVATERQMTERIGQARFLKELGPDDRNTLAHLAVQYGLDPIMSELIIYESKPYITLAGMLRAAHRQPEFEGLEDRPMTPEERTAYGIKAPVAWLVQLYRRGWRVPVKGVGTADPADPYRSNPIERKSPHIMARSRAIRQALRTGFPHCLPWNEVNTAGEDVEGMDPEVRIIDTETGEITSSNDHEEAATSEAQPVAQPAPETPAQTPVEAPANPTAERPSQALLTRWQAYLQQARQMGIDATDLEFDPNGDVSAANVVGYLNELLQRIADAKRPRAGQTSAAVGSGTS